MAAVIRKDYGIESQLIPGGGGVFEVCVDGARVYVNGPACGVPPVDEVMAPVHEALRT